MYTHIHWKQHLLIAAAMALLLGLFRLSGFWPLLRLETLSEDFRLRVGSPAPIEESLVWLSIDDPGVAGLLFPEEIEAEPALQGMVQWPWTGDAYALGIQKLRENGARVVAIDILLQSEVANTALLRQVIEEHRDAVVFAGMIVEEEAGASTMGSRQTVINANIFGSDSLYEILSSSENGRAGYVNFWPDYDGVFRRVHWQRPFGIVQLSSFATRILQKAGEERPTGHSRIRFAGPPDQNYTRYPFYHIFLDYPWKETFDHGAFFRDKIVVVGPHGPWVGDVLPSPYGEPMPGPEYHINAVGAALQNALIQETPVGAELLLIGFFAAGAYFACARIRWAITSMAILVAGAALYTVLSFLVYDSSANLLLPWAAPTISMLGTGAACLAVNFIFEQRERRQVRDLFCTMVSPQILHYMQADPSRLSLAGRRTEATIFFSDLAGFTTISEQLSPTQLAEVLNRYLTPMSRIIMQHGGYIDKFEGDAIMADFGVPVWPDQDRSSHALAACLAALDQCEAMRTLSAQLHRDFGANLRFRIGINTGVVSAGNMGSEERFQYTVMGDTVNQASRLEAANKIFGTQILLGEKTYQLVKDKVVARRLGRLRLKGKTEAVPCFELLGHRENLQAEQSAAHEIFEEGLHLFFTRDFVDARERFVQLPDDPPAQFYATLCTRLMADPPPEDWNGALSQTDFA